MIHRKFCSFLLQSRPQFALAFRNTAAALLALLVAASLQLESPYWAAMTAIIVIQPTRSLLFQKSFYRLVGTAIGAVAGLLLLMQSGSPIVVTWVLSLWIAVCVGVGNLLYGLRSYACMMAGLTCAVVAMSGYQDPPHLYGIAFGRIADVFVGIVVATAVTALLTPRRPGNEIEIRLRGVAAETASWLGLVLRQVRRDDLIRHEQELLISIAEVESLLDSSSAGLIEDKKLKRRLTSLIASLLGLLAIGRSVYERLNRSHPPEQPHAPWQSKLVGHLEEVAALLEQSKRVNCLSEMTGTVAEIKTRLPFLGQALEEVVLSLQSTLVTSGTLGDTQGREPMPKFIRHREWRQAGRAAIRAALAIGAVGITWAVSGWTQGPMMIMAMSIMLSIFSSKDHPAAFVGQIFIGAGIGSATAVICRLVLLPEIHDPFLAGVMLAPFILLGTFAMTQRRFAIAATDATLFFIFVAQPGVSVAIVPQDLVLAAIAMVMGVGSAWLAYRFLVPINPIIRMRSHLAAITRDIEALAAANDPSKQERLQARMQHRVIRLVSLASRYDPDHLRLIQGGLAALAIGRALRETHKHVNLLPAATRLINDNFGPLSTSARHTHEFLRALETVLIALHRLLVPGLENDCCTQPVATAYVGTANLLDLKQNSGPCPS